MSTAQLESVALARRRLYGRLLVVAAALLWSTGGLFVKAPVFDDWPGEIRGPLLAFWRAVWAGVLLLPAVRGARPRWALLPMSACFAGMNVAYLSSMVLTTAANAIWLQSSAPFWVFVLGACIWREAANPRDLVPLAFGLAGVGTIVYFESRAQTPMGIYLGLAAGICYAGVVLSLRNLRAENTVWLVVVNQFVSAAVLLPYVLYLGVWPDAAQLAVLAAFGIVQIGVPYVLFARGLRWVAAQEGSLIALLEPCLVPVWVYLAWGERTAPWTVAGAALILTGLLIRYARAAGR